MNKRIKTALVAAVVLFALGAVLLGAARLLGGSFSGTFSGNLFAGSKGFGSSTDAEGDYAVPSAGISSVKVDWASGRVDVKTGSDSQITFHESADRPFSSEEALRWKVEGSALHIRFAGGTTFWMEKDLTLVLPEELADTLEISTASADISVRQVSCRTLDLDTASGAVTVEADVSGRELEISTASGAVKASGSYDEAELDSASGAITFRPENRLSELAVDTSSGAICFEGAFDSCELDTSSGKMQVTLTDSFRELDVESSSGTLTLSFPETVGFRIDFDGASGEVVTDLPMTIQGKALSIGDPVGTLSMDTASGDLILQYAK